jgi:hypothetical protein
MSDTIPQSRPRTFRRLSSTDASSDFSLRSPTVIVPPQHLLDPSDAHEVAAAMELARLDLEDSASASEPDTPVETTVTDKFAFAFDIDGVLIRGGRPIPEAVEAMKVLNGKNAHGIKMWVHCRRQPENTANVLQSLHFRYQWWWQDRTGTLYPAQSTDGD